MDLDLSIDNYTYDDLMKLFKMPKYTFSSLSIQTKCDYVKKHFMEGHVFFCKASKLIECIYTLLETKELERNDVFIDQMMDRLCSIPDFNIYTIDELLKKIKPVVEPVMQVYSNPLHHGKLNSIQRVTQSQQIHLNSCFRQLPSMSTNFDYILPREIKHVSSMKLVSIELPNTRCLFSDQQNNNFFQIKKCNTVYDIVIPNGSYTNDSLEEYMQTHCDIVHFRIDEQFHTVIESDLPFTFYTKGAGWILGFRQACYENVNCVISEGLFDAIGDRYAYLSIEDYQYNTNVNNVVYFDKSYVDKSILAKILINDEKFALITHDHLCKVRTYNGPITLKKFHVTLYDKFCRVIDLQNMDFSFTLELELIYENF